MRQVFAQGSPLFIITMTLIVFIILLSRISERQTSIPPSLRLLLFWLQFLSLLLALSDAWPPHLLPFLTITSVFNFDIGYLGLGCDLRSSYLGILVFKAKHYYQFLKKMKELRWTKILSNFITNFFAIQIVRSLLQIFPA
jgi:hypothetical protein